jgi:hypothetical protein
VVVVLLGIDTSAGRDHLPCPEEHTSGEGVVHASDVALTEDWMIRESEKTMRPGKGHQFSDRCNWEQAGCAVYLLLEVAGRLG